MKFLSLLLLVSSTRHVAHALPFQRISKIPSWEELQQNWIDQSPFRKGKASFLLPFDDDALPGRVTEIELKRRGYIYGPSILGDISYFPTGPLGSALVQQHIDQWLEDSTWLNRIVVEEISNATEALKMSGGINEIDDYKVLYEGQWQQSMPMGPAPGILSNSTQDLLFAMERLSVNPYTVRRLHPTADRLPFEIDSITSIAISGFDLHKLHRLGRLFYVDHSYQASYPVTTGRFSAACSAYFFIDPLSGDFLPLAIKTNVGTDLVYTSLDTREDWLLAKTMFSVNDLLHGQIYHLANSHAVCEVAHLAALRTFSSSHPVLGVLNRLMHQAYAIRPMGEKVLFNPGGCFDQSFAITNVGVRQFATDFYPRLAGQFQANYFRADLESRGLVNCSYGPPLKNFPFLRDAGRLQYLIHDFMTSFVDTYYATEDILSQDSELQSWIQEASQAAQVIDFPSSPLSQKATLVDILTHFAFLTGVSHHVLNTGEPVATSGMLPFHPSALYAAPPTEKGVTDLMPFLTPAAEAVKHVALLARFNRPRLEDSNETLLYMFSDGEFLGRCRSEVFSAASKFHKEMKQFSEEVRSRKFDSQGLSQGMPFIWRGLDPASIPYFLSV